MELEARIGLDGQDKEAGSDRLCGMAKEICICGLRHVVNRAWAGTGCMFAAVYSGRGWANPCDRTLESHRMELESGRVWKLASESQLLRGDVGPMFMLAPQRGQRHVAGVELERCGLGGVLEASCWRARAMRAARRALAR